MSTRKSHQANDPMEDLRTQMERLEDQRVRYEHRAHLARQNLYGVPQFDTGHGWVESKH